MAKYMSRQNLSECLGMAADILEDVAAISDTKDALEVEGLARTLKWRTDSAAGFMDSSQWNRLSHAIRQLTHQTSERLNEIRYLKDRLS